MATCPSASESESLACPKQDDKLFPGPIRQAQQPVSTAPATPSSPHCADIGTSRPRAGVVSATASIGPSVSRTTAPSPTSTPAVLLPPSPPLIAPAQAVLGSIVAVLWCTTGDAQPKLWRGRLTAMGKSVTYAATLPDSPSSNRWLPMLDDDGDEVQVRCPWPPSSKVRVLACWQLASADSVPAAPFAFRPRPALRPVGTSRKQPPKPASMPPALSPYHEAPPPVRAATGPREGVPAVGGFDSHRSQKIPPRPPARPLARPSTETAVARTAHATVRSILGRSQAAPVPVPSSIPAAPVPGPATSAPSPVPPGFHPSLAAVPTVTNDDIARAIVTEADQAGDPVDDLFDEVDGPTQFSADHPEHLLEDLADQVYSLSADHFQSGSTFVPPGAAANTKVDELLRLLALPAPQLPALAMRGLMSSTMQEHRRMLRKLAESMPAELRGLPAPVAIVECLTRQHKERAWRCSSLLKNLATAQGALSNLPLYRATLVSIPLGLSSVWRMAMKAAARAARIELPNQPLAVGWQQVRQALHMESSLPTFAATLLSWVAAARSGCVLQLAKSDLTWVNESTLSIRFRRGKGASLRQTTYTVHTMIPVEFVARLRRWLDSRTSWVFPRTLKSFDVTKCLRKVDARYECRSIRRGALQHLAALPGITDETLLLFSGHSSVTTLRRYLNFGVKAVHTRNAMVPMAAQLCL